MNLRDRIIDFRRVKASELAPSPKNWRVHPPKQADALRGVLAEVGIADAVLARETPSGLELIDGHLRAETAPDAVWPVLVLDLSEEEADKLLAAHDPLTCMAETNEEKLGALLAGIATDSPALRAMFDALPTAPKEVSRSDSPPNEIVIPELHQVVVECRDEDDQAVLFERLTQEGYRCRVLTT